MLVKTECCRVVLLLTLLLSVSVGIADEPVEGEPTGARRPKTGENLESGGQSEVKSLIRRVQPSVMTIRVQGRDGGQLGIGTGFAVSADGLVATNQHVIGEGRKFTVETASGRKLKIVAVEASDRGRDLAVIRVDVGDQPLSPLAVSDSETPDSGTRVFAFGNPHGLRNSVVSGIVSAVQEIGGRDLIQMAMPTQPGNSGGPLVDQQGRVVGIVNMKSAVDDNLGFAVPAAELQTVLASPNPVAIDRWVRFGALPADRWTTLFDATWQQRGGLITAAGQGTGFGGRSLCLSTQETPELPFEVAVSVKFDDESGAAGIAFHSDAADRHYGFYPSAGGMRLTCFRGPSVYSWDVLHDEHSSHYQPADWNRLRVRVEKQKMQFFVNGELVFESRDRQLTSGRVGLVKFRQTEPSFRGFVIGPDLASKPMNREVTQWFDKIGDVSPVDVSTSEVDLLASAGDASRRLLQKKAAALERSAAELRKLAGDVSRARHYRSLASVIKASPDDVLLRGALIIAAVDQPSVDIDVYVDRVTEMASEIKSGLPDVADEAQRRIALDQYLFEENGFRGDTTEYYHRANSHLNRVIDDREGLPITLSILYLELGRQLGLRMEGVGLPGHFVVRHLPKSGEPQLIDVFERGQDVSASAAEMMVLANTGRALVDSDLRHQSTAEILSRVLNNLMGVAAGSEDADAMLRYAEAMVAVNPGQVRHRLARAQLRGYTGRLNAAIEDVDWVAEHADGQVSPAQIQQIRQAIEQRMEQ